jgi:hypothetical protein
MFLAMKGFSAQTIHRELVAVIGPDVIAFSTITEYRGQRQFPTISSEHADDHYRRHNS